MFPTSNLLVGIFFMGTSFVDFNGKGFWARDSSLEIWLEALVQAIDHQPLSSEWLTLVRRHWHLQAVAGCFGGWISPDLDGFATTHEQKRVLIALSEQAITALAAYGKVIPCEVLNAMLTDETVRPPERYFPLDVPSEHFLAVGRTFIQLLNGELTTTASTSPIL